MKRRSGNLRRVFGRPDPKSQRPTRRPPRSPDSLQRDWRPDKEGDEALDLDNPPTALTGIRDAQDLGYEVEGSAVTPPLEIVGHCPHCGAPIYGKRTIDELEIPSPAKYSCTCHRHSRQKVILG